MTIGAWSDQSSHQGLRPSDTPRVVQPHDQGRTLARLAAGFDVSPSYTPRT